MDDIDRKLMLLVFEGPRMPVQEISGRLGISRQTANHRLQALADMGVFKVIRTAISIHYLGLVPVYIWGRTTGTSVEKILHRFEENEFTDAVIVLGGGNLLVVGAPRRESGIDDYVDFVKRAAEMPEPTLGMPCFGDGMNPMPYDKGKPKKSYTDVSPVDLRIIASLDGNARRPIAEIAEIVGVSARTVRRRLERLQLGGVLTYDSPWDNPSGEDLFTLLYIDLRDGANNSKVARRLLSKYPLRVTVVRLFSNLPHFLMGVLKSGSMKEVRRILKEISEDEDILAVSPNTIYLEREYWSWDQRLPVALAPPTKKARRRTRRRIPSKT